MNKIILRCAGHLVLNYDAAAQALREALQQGSITIEEQNLATELKKVVDTAAGLTPPTAITVLQAHYEKRGFWLTERASGQIQVHIALSQVQGYCCMFVGSVSLVGYLKNIDIQPEWIYMGDVDHEPHVKVLNVPAFHQEFTPIQVMPVKTSNINWVYFGVGLIVVLIVICFFLLR